MPVLYGIITPALFCTGPRAPVGTVTTGGFLTIMANVCDICGKGPQFGQNIRHVHSGAWALRAPRTKRRWLPNLQNVRAVQNGEVKRLRVCTRCIKAGKVVRPS